jgi:hypothetical protein
LDSDKKELFLIPSSERLKYHSGSRCVLIALLIGLGKLSMPQQRILFPHFKPLRDQIMPFCETLYPNFRKYTAVIPPNKLVSFDAENGLELSTL